MLVVETTAMIRHGCVTKTNQPPVTSRKSHFRSKGHDTKKKLQGNYLTNSTLRRIFTAASPFRLCFHKLSVTL